MPDDLTARVEAILRASAHEDHAGYWEVRIPDAARAIAALIAEERVTAGLQGRECGQVEGRREGLEEAAGWQPIETAPRDGTVIWAWNGEQVRMRWESTADWSGWVYDDDLLNDVDPEPVPPDFWRPLLAPPIRALATEPRDDR